MIYIPKRAQYSDIPPDGVALHPLELAIDGTLVAHQVPGARCQVPGARCQVPRAFIFLSHRRR
jgi:hypothetical protein